MRTPAGVECAFFYEDHHRGREVAECRVRRSARSVEWSDEQCGRCPVPGILLANGSPHLELEFTAKRSILGRATRLTVTARCRLHDLPVPDPHAGCAQCLSEMFAGIDLEVGGDADV